jgi:head-tail adaptor
MIGELRDKVTLLAPVRVADGGGGLEISYDERATVPASSRTVSARRDRAMLAGFPLPRRRFAIRFRDDLVYEMRLRHDGRTYRITDIAEDDARRRYQIITAEVLQP